MDPPTAAHVGGGIGGSGLGGRAGGGGGGRGAAAKSGNNFHPAPDQQQQTIAPPPQRREIISATTTSTSTATTSTVASAPPDSAASSSSAARSRRFHCAKCNKTFSRIENLTRHQANHDDVGKFACAICQKRFTRSDLLNRHRKIHTAQAAAPGQSSHVTQTSLPSASSLTDRQGEALDSRSAKELPSRDPRDPRDHRDPRDARDPRDQRDPRDARDPRDPLAIRSHSMGFSTQQAPQQQGFYPLQHPDANANSYSHMQPPLNPSYSGQSQGLGQDRPIGIPSASALQHGFPPMEPMGMWDGFVGFEFAANNPNTYMGSYDAGLFWTLDSSAARPSLAYNSDQPMMNPVDDFPDLFYFSQQYAGSANPSVEIDNDEETTDWPDKINDPKLSSRRAAQSLFTNIKPRFWFPVLEEARISGWSNATYINQRTDDAVRQSMIFALNGSLHSAELTRPPVNTSNFPPIEVLDYFIHLYMQHIHPRFPLLHLPTFDIYTTQPLLLVAMMFLGSSHSNTDRGRFLHLFFGHLRIACIRVQELDYAFLRSVDGIQTVFLLCLAGTWSGNKQYYEFSEGSRAILVTACRRLRLLDCRPSRLKTDDFQRAGLRPETSLWLAWIETEKKKRLGLCISMYDCQYPALFNDQPYVSKAETANCVFPCDEAIWTAPTAEAWKNLVGPAEQPPPLYYLKALNACVLRRWTKDKSPIPIGDFGQLFIIYAIHGHIFEWRQAISMINPTGLMGISPPYDIGNGLRARRKWLVDGLDSWGECYSNATTSTAALLLHQLGYVALDVSLSDMHLVAGRSKNQNDGKFAEENLKCWANSKISDSTMTHVFGMLRLCHQCIRSNMVASASYEVAVCLLTGGIVCWAYGKLKVNGPKEQCIAEVRQASVALNEMGCWRMSSIFGRILSSFEGQMN